jgi:hypothetical protein
LTEKGVFPNIGIGIGQRKQQQQQQQQQQQHTLLPEQRKAKTNDSFQTGRPIRSVYIES